MRIVIVEDHLMFREAVRKACAQDFGYRIVGETDSGFTAVSLTLEHRPDVLILDLSLPDLDGFSVIHLVRQSCNAVRILVLSAYYDEYTVYRLEKLAVQGFVDKNTNSITTLKDALSALGNGGTYFSRVFQNSRAARQSNPCFLGKILSPREQRILSLIGRGLDDSEIGQKLAISPRTAQTHRHSILQKLDIKGTPKLIAFAIEHGLNLGGPTEG